MAKMTKALWHHSPHHSALDEVHSLPLKTNELIQVKSLYSLISTGTESLVATGSVPKDLYKSMQVPYMEGKFSFPIKYGYSLVGEITAHHADAGQMVHLLHPHQNQCWVAPDDLFSIPKEVPAKRAALASNLETALTAVWDGQVGIGDRVMVIGFGMIGALVTRLLSFLPAVEVLVVEKNKDRRQRAKEMGFKTIVDNEISKTVDIAFHTSASTQGLQMAIDSVGFEGKIIEMSWYGKRKVELTLGSSFHQMRKQIICSQVGHIPSQKSARWNYKRRKEVVFQLLKNPVFDQHITHTISFEESPSFFQKLRSKNLPDGLGWCIEYT